MPIKPVLINITYQGRSGNWFTQLDPGISDDDLRRLCEEAVHGGEVPGLPSALPGNAFGSYVVDRFHENATRSQARFVVRPRVPFG